MNFFQAKTPTPRDLTQSRLMALAAVFLFLYAVILSLSPAARLHSLAVPYRWEHWAGLAVWLVGFNFLNRQSSKLLPDRDPILLPLAALLSGWGLLTIWRLDTMFGLRQTIWLAVSLLAFWAGMRTPSLLALLRRYKYLELTGGLLLTALTFLFGIYPGGVGPHLWLGCCGVYLQPSEPLKLLLIVYLAAYLADHLPFSRRLSEMLGPTLLLTGAAMVILLGQRDLGTATIFLFLYSLVIFLASGKRRILVISAVAILAAGVIGYGLFSVIRIRVSAWANPWADAAGGSYQIVQSLIAVASGGLFGAGPGMGSPSLVPVAHSDFIFSAIAEESGLIGTIALMGLIGLLAARGLRAALYAPNNYQRYLAAGLTAYLCAQGIYIVAGNMRLLPLTGVTLPFVSYGGSSLLTSFVSILLLTLMSSTAEREPAPLPNPRPYLLTGAALLAGLTAIALANGWWAAVRSDDLVARIDNPRRFVNSRYVRRGALLDRNNRPIDSTEGQPGNFTRRNLYTPLAATVGYSNPLYGEAGLEGSLDNYLSGLQGSPASEILTNRLLYNQPPPGLNVRTSLDLDLQERTDKLLEGHKGALVLLNAQTGEVLVIASHPYFDPGLIEQKWSEWLQDSSAPLLNRVTQGQYSPGTAVGPFLLAAVLNQGQLPELPTNLSYTSGGRTWNCNQVFTASPAWNWAVANGCPGALITLGRQSGLNQLGALYHQLGFYEAPNIPLPGAIPPKQADFTSPELAALGEDNVQVTPLQMALAASAISTGGQQPEPRMVIAVQTATQGWVVLPSGSTKESLPASGANEAAKLLAVDGAPFWEAQGTGQTAQGRVSWYVSGKLPGSQGTPPGPGPRSGRG